MREMSKLENSSSAMPPKFMGRDCDSVMSRVYRRYTKKQIWITQIRTSRGSDAPVSFSSCEICVICGRFLRHVDDQIFAAKGEAWPASALQILVSCLLQRHDHHWQRACRVALHVTVKRS